MNNWTKKLAAIFASLVMLSFSLGYAKDEDRSYMSLNWDQLVPTDYDIEKLENDLLGQYDIDNILPDSLEATELFAQLQQLQYSAPMTYEYDQVNVRIPGFIVPLEFEGSKIISFLLVPYFGACIHTPPPPPNQIIYVELQEGIEVDNTYDPFYITGILRVESQDSELGTAGYTIYSNTVEPYY